MIPTNSFSFRQKPDQLCKEKASQSQRTDSVSFLPASYLPSCTMNAVHPVHEYHIIPNSKIRGLTHHSIAPVLCLRGSMFFHGDSVPRLPSLQEKHDKSCSTCQTYPSTIIPVCTAKLIGMEHSIPLTFCCYA